MASKIWLFFLQVLLLIGVYHIGNFFEKFFHLMIPGNVIGMVILLLLLSLRIVKLDQVEIAAGWLLKHLGFFFIPISVGLMTIDRSILSKGWLLLIILIISAFVGLISAGKATQAVITQKEKVRVKEHDHSL